MLDRCGGAHEPLADALEHRARAGGVLRAKLIDELVDGAREPLDAPRPRASSRRYTRRLERRARALSEPSALSLARGPEELDERPGLAAGEVARRDGERRGELLVPGQRCQRVEHTGAMEPRVKELEHLGTELAEDLEATLDPLGLSPQAASDRRRREFFCVGESGQDLELLEDASAAPGVVAREALKKPLDPPPGFHDDPGLLDARSAQREAALEAVDEDEATRVLDDHQRIIEVDGAGGGRPREELERHLGEGDLPERAHRAGSAGRERTW